MTLAQLRVLARGMIPGAKIQFVANDVLDLILNEGVKDIAANTCCLKTNKKFNVVASKFEYNLSAVLGDYLAVDKSGLFWSNGTVYRPVYPKTLKWFDENRPTWRNAGNASPMEYSIDADTLTVTPPPAVSLTNGFWLYYGQKPLPMTEETHYPFSGSAVEYTHLSIFDFAIILFAKWKIEPMLNKDQDANLSMQEYLRERAEKENTFNKRRDIMAANDARMR
jgi:hypothetical protein